MVSAGIESVCLILHNLNRTALCRMAGYPVSSTIMNVISSYYLPFQGWDRIYDMARYPASWAILHFLKLLKQLTVTHRILLEYLPYSRAWPAWSDIQYQAGYSFWYLRAYYCRVRARNTKARKVTVIVDLYHGIDQISDLAGYPVSSSILNLQKKLTLTHGFMVSPNLLFSKDGMIYDQDGYPVSRGTFKMKLLRCRT